MPKVDIEAVFQRALPEVEKWAGKDINFPPSMGDWRLFGHGMSLKTALLVIGADSVSDHYAVLMHPDEESGDYEVLGISHREGRLHLVNPFLGEYLHIRPEVDGLCCYDTLAVAFVAQPGLQQLRYVRRGRDETVDVDADTGRVFIIDWESANPVERYTGLKVDGEWTDPVAPYLPFTTAFAAESWNAYQPVWDKPEGDRHSWIGTIFYEIEDDDYCDMTLKLLRAMDAEKHVDGLGSLGAGPIYGNGHWFYDAIEADASIPPANVYQALLLERPEFLPQDVAQRYHALMVKLKQQLKL
ncbi:MAG: hypothetical protein ACR2PO_10330 [Methyloligellaceae bacterium]